MNISVYITSYNQKNFLREAVESVLAQTMRPAQIIIIDDCSTDGSRDVIIAYKSRFPSVITPVFHEQNTGIAQSRIDALRAVTGDYVSYVDGDDRFLPRKLEQEAHVLSEGTNAQAVFSNNYYISEEGERTGVWAENVLPPENDIFCETFARDFPKRNLFRMELIRYSALQNIGFHDPELALYEDFDLRIRLAKSATILYCNEPLSEIRVHRKGLSSRTADEHLAALNYIYKKNSPLLEDLDRRKKNYVSKRYYHWMSQIAQRAARRELQNGFHFGAKTNALRYLIKAFQYSPVQCSLKLLSVAYMPFSARRFKKLFPSSR